MATKHFCDFCNIELQPNEAQGTFDLRRVKPIGANATTDLFINVSIEKNLQACIDCLVHFLQRVNLRPKPAVVPDEEGQQVFTVCQP